MLILAERFQKFFYIDRIHCFALRLLEFAPLQIYLFKGSLQFSIISFESCRLPFFIGMMIKIIKSNRLVRLVIRDSLLLVMKLDIRDSLLRKRGSYHQHLIHFIFELARNTDNRWRSGKRATFV